jgi:hypothetical protein
MKIAFLIFVLVIGTKVKAEEYSFEIAIKNQPGHFVVLGALKGDRFNPVDTLKAQDYQPNKKTFIYNFGINQRTGVYRIIMGQTTYAKVMNEAPQQLDFIFNHENIHLETDFKSPVDSLKIIQSEENRIWYKFLVKQKKIKEQMVLAEKEMDYYRQNQQKEQLQESINRFNDLQIRLEKVIHSITKNHSTLFATELVKMYRRPIVDGKLTPAKRKGKWQNQFFSVVNFTNEKLINSPVLTAVAFEYVMSYAQSGISKDLQIQSFLVALVIL